MKRLLNKLGITSNEEERATVRPHKIVETKELEPDTKDFSKKKKAERKQKKGLVKEQIARQEKRQRQQEIDEEEMAIVVN